MHGVAMCAGTVDQYAACLNEIYYSSYPHLMPPCGQLTTEKLVALGDAGPGPACEAFFALCPDSAFPEAMMSSALKLERR